MLIKAANVSKPKKNVNYESENINNSNAVYVKFIIKYWKIIEKNESFI